MRTNFTAEQLRDPDNASSEKILRACVHCGFCTATCPTYLLLGDELDSPRGRIYLMKQMLEGQKKPTAETVKHIDRCLSCLSCMTTCPSGVHYMHLVDHGRRYIEENFRRPLADRALRRLLAWLLPYPGRARLAFRAGIAGRGLTPWLRRLGQMAGAEPARRLDAMLELMPEALPDAPAVEVAQVHAAEGPRRARVALLGRATRSR